jgi:hypothetical protein
VTVDRVMTGAQRSFGVEDERRAARAERPRTQHVNSGGDDKVGPAGKMRQQSREKVVEARAAGILRAGCAGVDRGAQSTRLLQGRAEGNDATCDSSRSTVLANYPVHVDSEALVKIVRNLIVDGHRG